MDVTKQYKMDFKSVYHSIISFYLQCTKDVTKQYKMDV